MDRIDAEKKGRRDPRNNQGECWNSLAGIEKQKREWDRGVRNPSLMKKAESVIEGLNGRRFCLDTLSEKHFDIYLNYLVLAAKRR